MIRWVYGLQQLHEMLAGSHAGQELNYLLSIGADSASGMSGAGSASATRKHASHLSDRDATYGLQSGKPLAALQADSHMKHVDMCVFSFSYL